MRGYAIEKFGVPGAVRELPLPEPGVGEILVRVKAAGVNAFDATVVAGFAKDYMEHRFPLVPGKDVSGVVQATGPGVTGYAAGDEIFGLDERPFIGAGTFAEFVTVATSAASRKPRNLDHVTAAALPTAGLTAQSAVDAASPAKGETVLILGATGGVGSFATQLSAASGARVLAVTRGDHAAYARKLGAAETIDYTEADVAEVSRSLAGNGLDVILDFAGDRELVARLADVVRPGGRIVSTVGAADIEALAARGITGLNVNRGDPQRLGQLARLVDDGTLRAPATHVYPLEDAAEALQLQAGRHVQGKLIIAIGE